MPAPKDQYPECLITPGKLFIVWDRDEDILEPSIIDVMVPLSKIEGHNQQVSLDELVKAWLQKHGIPSSHIGHN